MNGYSVISNTRYPDPSPERAGYSRRVLGDQTEALALIAAIGLILQQTARYGVQWGWWPTFPAKVGALLLFILIFLLIERWHIDVGNKLLRTDPPGPVNNLRGPHDRYKFVFSTVNAVVQSVALGLLISTQIYTGGVLFYVIVGIPAFLILLALVYSVGLLRRPAGWRGIRDEHGYEVMHPEFAKRLLATSAVLYAVAAIILFR